MQTKAQLAVRTLVALVVMAFLAPALPLNAFAEGQNHVYATCATADTEITEAQTGGKIGSTYRIAGSTYKVTSNSRSTASLTKAKNAKSIVVPAAVKIGGKVYRVTAISPRAFAAAKRLARVRVGENVTCIGRAAFFGCSKLAKASGGASVQTIGSSAFGNCAALRQCDPLGSEKLEKIGMRALKNATKFKAITVKSMQLTKTGVRKALEGSAVSTIKIQVGTYKANKVYVKWYARFLTEKNCGKRVTMKPYKRTLVRSEQTEDAALAAAWKADFKRLSKASGMEICVYALDLASGTSATYRSGTKVLSASMIKLLIAETFLKQVADGKQKLDDVYELKSSDIVGGTGSLGGRGVGAEVTKREMLKLMITESDNVATNVLIDQCGMSAINGEAKRLGLKCTTLGRRMMDTDAAAKGHDNYTCADDLAALFKMVYDKTFVNKEMSALMLECLEAQTDNTWISRGLPAGTRFAHKTGALGSVRHDGGIVEGKRPFILVTLCGGKGFNVEGAREAMGQIGEAAYLDLKNAR